MNLGRLNPYVRGLRTFPGDAALAYQLEGAAGLWRALAERSLYHLARHGHLLVIAQTLDSFREVPPPGGVTIAQATAASWQALAPIATQRTLDRFHQRSARGHVCLLAWRGDRAIGYTWCAERVGPDILPYPISFPPTAAYLFDLYVVRPERANGVGSALVSARLTWARERGLGEGWRMISPSNHASVRTVEKTAGRGARVVGEIRYVRILGRVYGRYQPLGQ